MEEDLKHAALPEEAAQGEAEEDASCGNLCEDDAAELGEDQKFEEADKLAAKKRAAP